MLAEAKGLAPGVYGAQVKVGLGPQVALHPAPEDARDLIRSVAEEATRHIDGVAPYTILGPPPYEQEIIIWARTDPAGYLSRGFRQTGARSFKRANRLDELMI